MGISENKYNILNENCEITGAKLVIVRQCSSDLCAGYKLRVNMKQTKIVAQTHRTVQQNDQSR